MQFASTFNFCLLFLFHTKKERWNNHMIATGFLSMLWFNQCTYVLVCSGNQERKQKVTSWNEHQAVYEWQPDQSQKWKNGNCQHIGFIPQTRPCSLESNIWGKITNADNWLRVPRQRLLHQLVLSIGTELPKWLELSVFRWPLSVRGPQQLSKHAQNRQNKKVKLTFGTDVGRVDGYECGYG